MNDKKSGFLTFIFSFIPGAGQMYLGAMKKGAVLMTVSIALFGISAFLGNGIFTVFIPVIWFYAFFDTFNLKNKSYEERLEDDDKFMKKINDIIGGNWKVMAAKTHTFIGAVLIFMGIFMIYQNFFMPMVRELCDYYNIWEIYYSLNNMPSFVVGLLVIFVGIKLLKGKNISSDKTQDFVEYHGDDKNE